MKLLEFLQGPKNELSSKRLFGLVCLVCAIVFAAVGKEVSAGEFLAAASVVFLGQAATKT